MKLQSYTGTTNLPAYIDFKYSAWKNPFYDFTKLITSHKQCGCPWAILHYTHTAVRHDILKNDHYIVQLRFSWGRCCENWLLWWQICLWAD
jgi:hypothetical protein